MQIKCDYCGKYINDTDIACPCCGAQNDHLKRATNDTPKTIAQLQQWYIDRNLPPEKVTRFFIGKNYPYPKAFGIYEENGRFIVYKNKANGQRAIRYEGRDEAYAVNELYLKLKEEILNQKANNIKRISTVSSIKIGAGIAIFYLLFFVSIILLVIFPVVMNMILSLLITGAIFVLLYSLSTIFKRKLNIATPQFLQKGHRSFFVKLALYLMISILIFFPVNSYFSISYYRYNDNIYCRYHNDFFIYDGYNDYSPVSDYSLPFDFYNNYEAYEWEYDDSTWSGYSFTAFDDSNYYDEHYSSSSDSDSSYDWDSNDSWDSGGSDWDSDW